MDLGESCWMGLIPQRKHMYRHSICWTHGTHSAQKVVHWCFLLCTFFPLRLGHLVLACTCPCIPQCFLLLSVLGKGVSCFLWSLGRIHNPQRLLLPIFSYYPWCTAHLDDSWIGHKWVSHSLVCICQSWLHWLFRFSWPFRVSPCLYLSWYLRLAL